MTTRRSFLQHAGGAITLAGLRSSVASAAAPESTKPSGDDLFKLGMAGYTFLNFNLDQALEMMRKTDVHYLCIKDFHLPFASTAEQIAAFHDKLKQSGVTGYGVGPIYMKTTQEIDNGFDYAKRVGVKLIVGVPNEDLLPYVEKKGEGIRYAVRHSHSRPRY